MAQLADALGYVNQREIEKKEAEIAADFPPPSNELPRQEQLNLFPFTEWCRVRGVRCLGARPTSVAAYLRGIVKHDHVKPEFLPDAVAAIEAVHDATGLANPCATLVVRETLEELMDIRPPRSWTKAEKISFARLPAEVRAAIERRDHDRETRMRIAQNERADAIKELKRLTDSAETKPVILEKETTHGEA